MEHWLRPKVLDDRLVLVDFDPLFLTGVNLEHFKWVCPRLNRCSTDQIHRVISKVTTKH